MKLQISNKIDLYFIVIRQWIFDVKAFDNKHQHVLLPTSFLTGTTHVVVSKIRDHVLTYTKKPNSFDLETTTVRPTIIDISKIKKRHIDEFNSDECGCYGVIPIADGIAEHLADKKKPLTKSKTNLELHEESSRRI